MTRNKAIAATMAGMVMVAGMVISQGIVFAAAKTAAPVKVAGMARFVFQGNVTSVATGAVALHIVKTSKNAKVFDNQDKTLAVGSKTKITKNGKKISLSGIKTGDTIRVFGIFNKKTGAIVLVRWIKVFAK